MTTKHTQTIFDFTKESSLSNWRVVDDVVMGGVSNGNLIIDKNGHGKYSGSVSTANNGGFSSIRIRFSKMEVDSNTHIVLTAKGDQKKYQIRVKDNQRNYFSYIQDIQTSDSWQTFKLPLSDFYPSFRGRKLNAPKFDQNQIEEMAILIGNKQNEDFQLLIDKIELQSK